MSRSRDEQTLFDAFGVETPRNQMKNEMKKVFENIDQATGEIFSYKERQPFPSVSNSVKTTHTISLRPDGSRRVQLHSTDPVITDQAAAQDMTMASIVKKLQNGIMPNLAQGLIYTTDLGIRNLQDVVERQTQVNDLFYQLPIDVRKLMQHDISNFEKVIFDPKNSELLAKHGLTIQARDNHQELLNAVHSLKPSSDVQKPVEKL